jgi:hypothetical protein
MPASCSRLQFGAQRTAIRGSPRVKRDEAR